MAVSSRACVSAASSRARNAGTVAVRSLPWPYQFSAALSTVSLACRRLSAGSVRSANSGSRAWVSPRSRRSKPSCQNRSKAPFGSPARSRSSPARWRKISQLPGMRGGGFQAELGERAFEQSEAGGLPGRSLRWFDAAEGPGPVAAEEGGDDAGGVAQLHREVFDADHLNVKVAPVLPLQRGDLVHQRRLVVDAGGGGEHEPGGLKTPRRRGVATVRTPGRSGIVDDGSADRARSDGLQPPDLVHEPLPIAVLANDVQAVLLLAPPPVHVDIAGSLSRPHVLKDQPLEHFWRQLQRR